jgi:hypothetical protein
MVIIHMQSCSTCSGTEKNIIPIQTTAGSDSTNPPLPLLHTGPYKSCDPKTAVSQTVHCIEDRPQLPCCWTHTKHDAVGLGTHRHSCLHASTRLPVCLTGDPRNAAHKTTPTPHQPAPSCPSHLAAAQTGSAVLLLLLVGPADDTPQNTLCGVAVTTAAVWRRPHWQHPAAAASASGSATADQPSLACLLPSLPAHAVRLAV